mgnify:FL=1
MQNIYNGSLTREQFLFYETRITAQLVCQDLPRDEIIERIKSENLFQFPTEKMVVSIARTCFRRLDALASDALVQLLAEAPMGTAKQVNLYAMMKDNRVVWDFMTTVIGEKYRTQALDFSPKDVSIFLFLLREQNDSVAGWSDSTVSKIRQVLIRILTECRYLDSIRASQLNWISIEPELEDKIRAQHDMAALPAFNCFR